MTPVALVTGSNKGIGFGIVKGLCEKFPGIVYLTARDEERGKAAVAELNKLGLKPEFHQLDVTNKESTIRLRNFIQEKHGGLDVLVNNAGIAFKASATEPVSVQAEVTLATNYFALVDFCNEIFPLLRPHARVVNISSSSGHLLRIPGEEIRKQFLNPDLSVDLLSKLMQSYVTAAKNGNHEALGWGSSSYVVSKVGVSKLSFIQQATFDKNGPEDVIVNAVHPGYVDTDMTSHKGPLTIEEGAAAAIYLSLLPQNIAQPRGAYIWHDKRVVDWTKPPPAVV
ncbi:carbonyl reductase [NADPH] 1-like [Frankliniella occidentalis]|uniref:carbonyl reductase (NADPH) n=1 Tax=Frankliniella occidentalis TaxID=133901 RepID=A0A9C6XB43_FRAOC|nr:carbonyl reductase [NADPH] 1-like [Frankliniella occidentalis]